MRPPPFQKSKGRRKSRDNVFQRDRYIQTTAKTEEERERVCVYVWKRTKQCEGGRGGNKASLFLTHPILSSIHPSSQPYFYCNFYIDIHTPTQHRLHIQSNINHTQASAATTSWDEKRSRSSPLWMSAIDRYCTPQLNSLPHTVYFWSGWRLIPFWSRQLLGCFWCAIYRTVKFFFYSSLCLRVLCCPFFIFGCIYSCPPAAKFECIVGVSGQQKEVLL